MIMGDEIDSLNCWSQSKGFVGQTSASPGCGVCPCCCGHGCSCPSVSAWVVTLSLRRALGMLLKFILRGLPMYFFGQMERQ